MNQEIIYSVIVPVFNSEESLQELVHRIKKVLSAYNCLHEIILIDDGSIDNSWEVITQLKQENNDILIAIRFSKNFGQHNAILCGLSKANGKYIITIDDDLQIPPEEISKLIEAQTATNADLIYGYYPNKKHSSFRNIGSKVVKKTGKALYNNPGEGSSFRMIKTELAKKTLSHLQSFVYIDEILLWYTNNIHFVKVEHEARKYCKSGYSSFKLFSMSANIVFYYTAIPLRLMVYGGIICSILSFLTGIYFIIRKVLFKVPHGYTSLIVAILFSTGIIILCLGIIGEYLNRIYIVQNKKPPYAIREIQD